MLKWLELVIAGESLFNEGAVGVIFSLLPWLPALRTEPSRMCDTLSFSRMSATSMSLSLNVQEVEREMTRSSSIFASRFRCSPAMPSAKYSCFQSALMFRNVNMRTERLAYFSRSLPANASSTASAVVASIFSMSRAG